MTSATPTLFLWALLGLFALHVVGQVIVMLWEPRWLPPPKQWFSGLVAYPYLLLFQILFLALMTAMILELHPGVGPFGSPSAGFSVFCVSFSVPYYGFMIYRWVFRVLRNPSRRWFNTLILRPAHAGSHIACVSSLARPTGDHPQSHRFGRRL